MSMDNRKEAAHAMFLMGVLCADDLHDHPRARVEYERTIAADDAEYSSRAPLSAARCSRWTLNAKALSTR